MGEDTTLDPRCTIIENTKTLSFNTAGGQVTGVGSLHYECVFQPQCGTDIVFANLDLQGTYSPQSNTFEGTHDWSTLQYTWTAKCQLEKWRDSRSGTWQASLEDGLVRGSMSPVGALLQLIVQD
jgi:hypothetical protein